MEPNGMTPKVLLMIRMRIRIVFSGLLVFGFISVACHRTATVQRNPDVGPMVKDTTTVARVIKDTARVAVIDTSLIAFFKDTAPTRVFFPEARNFKLQTPGQRQSLRAI